MAAKEKQTPIKDALGLGERLALSNGAYVECAPACLADLEDVMGNWNTFVQKANGTIQIAYLPDNAEAKEAFEELLYVACGRKIAKDDLRKMVTVKDGGREVLAFLQRFLGFEPRVAGDETGQTEG